MSAEITYIGNEVISGTTESGFKYVLDPEVMDDFEILEELCDIDKGDATKIITVAKRMLGKDQMKALKEHLRNEKGRVPASKMIEEITEILKGGKTKNS